MTRSINMATSIFLRVTGQSGLHRNLFSTGSTLGQRICVVPCINKSCWVRSDVQHCSSEKFSPYHLQRACLDYQKSLLHTSTISSAWESHNKTVYPPQKPDEPRRAAEIYYARRDIKHSQRKMWYIATFIKGMMIDDALNQLEHINKKAAKIAREVLLEAQEEAVKNHNVEFKSNLHISEALVGKGKYQHAIRYHAKGRASLLDLVYCHLFLKLKEGPPPEKPALTGYDQAKHYLESKRKRTITHGL